MPVVDVPDQNGFELAMRRFKRSCEKAGVAKKWRMIEFHEKRSEKRKRRHSAALKRYAKKLQKEHEALERERGRQH